MAGNPLVAEKTDTATAFSGASLLDDGAQLSHAIESGDWVEGGVAAFSLAVDTVAAVSDPIGTLIGHGLGWLIDHLQPLKGWFDDLTGDAGEVQAFSQTWSNISTQLSNAGQELNRILSDVEDQAGQTMDAYRTFQRQNAQHIQASAGLASAFSAGLGIASTIVQLVHDLLRDVLSQLVGSAISWAAEEVFSLGLATPWVIEQVSTRVASLVSKVGTKLKSLLASVGKLKGLLAKAESLLKKLGDLFGGALHRGGGPSTHAGAPVRAPRTTPFHAGVGEPLSPSELRAMADEGYHTSVFNDEIAPLYDRDSATLGAPPTPGNPNPHVWAMPTEDAAGIHSVSDAARQTGMAPFVEKAYLQGGDVYAAHFPVDPSELRRPHLADAGTNPHFYPDPTNSSTVYGHTAVNTGSGMLVNETRETLVPSGNAMPPGSVLTKLVDGAWVVVRKF